jgi:hypothetical protein
MSSTAIRLPTDQALRLADDLDAKRRETWEDEDEALDHDHTGETYARFARWSEDLSDGLRRDSGLIICDDPEEAEEWWAWLMNELAGLVEVASDWTNLGWCADLMVLKCRLIREAVGLGWRVVVDQAPDVWIEDPARQLARQGWR